MIPFTALERQSLTEILGKYVGTTVFWANRSYAPRRKKCGECGQATHDNPMEEYLEVKEGIIYKVSACSKQTNADSSIELEFFINPSNDIVGRTVVFGGAQVIFTDQKSAEDYGYKIYPDLKPKHGRVA